jgi:hypothetical protein
MHYDAESGSGEVHATNLGAKGITMPSLVQEPRQFVIHNETTHQVPEVRSLEIFRLFGELPDLSGQAEWSQITKLLTIELKARGISGYLIRTPILRVRQKVRTQTFRVKYGRYARGCDCGPGQPRVLRSWLRVYEIAGR